MRSLMLLQTPPAPPLPCAGTQGAVGGYTPVAGSSVPQSVAPAAWQAFTNTNSLTGCAVGTAHPLSYTVTQACTQVSGDDMMSPLV